MGKNNSERAVIIVNQTFFNWDSFNGFKDKTVRPDLRNMKNYLFVRIFLRFATNV